MLFRFTVVCLLLLLPSIPAHAQNRPFRVAAGYDGATVEGELAGDFFEGGYQSSTGALRLDVSYDVFQKRERPAGFVYATFAESVFAYAYNGYGFGVRFHGGDRRDGLYGGVGVGLYIPSKRIVRGNDGKVGAKLFVGYDTRGALFLESGFTIVGASDYTPAPSIALGVRF